MPEIQNTVSPGEIVGHYQIISLAGAGGMGVVYKAFDEKLQRTVALKFLPTSATSSEKEKARFIKEARAASSLDHPNIGVIYGVEELSQGGSYIVMAYYEGESLAQKIRGGPLSYEKATDIALQMICGLDYAHRHKIVHRDIKPSNVMVTPDNVVKIVDFGLAGLIKSEIETVSVEFGGTIGYMSPEQTLRKPVDQRTDIWAWGIVLVEMLTGQHPYRRNTIPATVDAILSAAPQGIEQIPALIQPIVYHALAKRPQDRYQSCAEIVAELEFARNQLNSSTETVETLAPTHSLDSKDFKKRISAASDSGATRISRERKLILTSCVLAVMLVAAFFVATPLRFQFTSRSKHIAVLPFDNIGNDPANEPIAAGLMETITGKLSNLDTNNDSLWVVPASEVRRRNISDPSSALRDLGAALAVKGTFERRGEDVRLTANLIDTKNLRQLGSVVIENRSGDLSALQDETVRRLASLMNVVAPRKDAAVSVAESGAPAAYEEYLKAVGFMQRYDQPGNLDNAIKSLVIATEVDPSFALAYAQLGEAYRLKFQLDQNPKWLADALANCQKAAEIDHRVMATYVTLGRIHEMSGKHDLAVQEFHRVLDSNPRDANALAGMARSYENAGHIHEAEEAYKKAVALRPDYWDSHDELGLFYDRQGKYSEALKELQQAASLTPDNAQIYSNIGAVYTDKGDPQLFREAEKNLKKSLELGPSYSAYANLGNLYYIEKRYSESAAMTEMALQLNSNDYLVWNNLIVAYKWLRESHKIENANERLRQLLEHAVQVKPEDAMAQSLLAILYAEKKRRQESIIRIQTALALAPNDPEILENVAIAYEKLDDQPQSMQYISDALAKGLSIDELKGEPDLQSLIATPEFQRRIVASGNVMK